MEDDVDVWRYAILELHARNDDDEMLSTMPTDSVQALNTYIVLQASDLTFTMYSRSIKHVEEVCI